MAFLSSMNMVGSGLTAQQLRLDVISENVTNISTTRTEGGGAFPCIVPGVGHAFAGLFLLQSLP